MVITAKTKICMVIGDPIEHSRSPRMHNAGYAAAHLDDEYVYVACHVEAQQIGACMDGVRAMHIRGVSCTLPHKVAVIPHLDALDTTAQAIGAVNTIVNDEGRLVGYNTDWLGVLDPLEQLISLRGKTVALIGAGGAARAAAYAVSQQGAHLVIYNRSLDRAAALAETFGGVARPLEDLEGVSEADVILNSVPAELQGMDACSPLEKRFNSRQIVFDMVYGHISPWIQAARAQGAKTVVGTEMLLYQGVAQFKLFTGCDAPIEAMRDAIQSITPP